MAQIIPFDRRDFLWKRIIQPDIAKFLDGRQREMCAANIGRALGFGLFDEIEPIRACWAKAEQMKAAEAKESA
jgi:hypothetical protein